MDRSDRQRIVAAVEFALEAHADQTRKGSRIPYASHLLQVAGLVMEHGGDVDQAVAGMLHDAIEDCADVDAADLRARFGGDVAAIVEACTDTLPGDSPDAKSPWPERKRAYLERIGTSSARVRLVAACDKLHNLRSLIADLHADGIGTLDRFTADPGQLRWYHESVADALGADLPPRLREELDGLVASLASLLRDFAPAPHPRPDPASRD